MTPVRAMGLSMTRSPPTSSDPMSRCRIGGAGAFGVALVLAGACAREQPRTPEAVRAELLHLLPREASDRGGWTDDLQSAFAALEIAPTTQSLCASLAVIAQESSNADPTPSFGQGRSRLGQSFLTPVAKSTIS